MTEPQIAEACKALVARGTKPTLPEVKPLIDAFYAIEENGAGGSLHIVLDDGNYERRHIEFCIKYAEDRNDEAGAWLGRVLLLLSNSQRRRM